MPRKIRQLIADLEKAGFVNNGGKGSHRKFIKLGFEPVVISGKTSDDAKRYQEKMVTEVLQQIKK